MKHAAVGSQNYYCVLYFMYTNHFSLEKENSIETIISEKKNKLPCLLTCLVKNSVFSQCLRLKWSGPSKIEGAFFLFTKSYTSEILIYMYINSYCNLYRKITEGMFLMPTDLESWEQEAVCVTKAV